MKLKSKNVLVYGLSVSGFWCSELAKKKQANVFLFDDDPNKIKMQNFANCFAVQKIDENFVKNINLIIVSPSIEKDNENLILARRFKVQIMSEIEFASMFCKNYVAITGTNGKTTTTQLVTHILNTSKKAVACGNIGYPMSKAVLSNKSAIKVVEVSSFMLENCLTFSPHVATVLNIEPDHLIRHKTMQEYKNLKLSIFKNLTKNDYAIVNLDLNICPTQNTKTITYSYKHKADVYVRGGYIYVRGERLVAINQLKIVGKHNINNAMCAICVALAYKISNKNILKALLSFLTDDFRIQKIATVKGINFVNDSKSTNIASTLASVEAIKGSIILLLGGSKKDLEYKPLFTKLTKRVKQVVAFGEIANDLYNANNKKFSFQKCKDLKQAFNVATENAQPNDTILLSPASASFDQFANYIERGKTFNDLVKDYEKNK